MSELALSDFAAVRAALGQRVADAKFLAKGRRNLARAADSDGMSTASEAVDVLPAVFHLTYEDTGGLISERVVTIRRIERRGVSAFYLHGFCHLRKSQRCFAVERIVEGFDITTGELFDDPRSFFGEHPIYTSPAEPEGEALKVCRHEINLLTVLGASDGLFDPEEQDVVLIHLYDRNDHLRLDEERLRGLLALVAPDGRAFDASLMQMARFKAGDAQMLKRSMRKLVDADGRISPEEIRFVSEIESRLGLV